MFGYIVPNQDELKVRELREYRSYYCGLCRCLKEQYGFKGQISLTYDMTFLGMLLTALYEPECISGECRCIAHPMQKHSYITSEHMKYAADMNVLLTYYKCLDDWNDDRKLIKAGYSKILYLSGRKISNIYPERAAKVRDGLESLAQAEQSQSCNLDEVSGYFGNICSALFVYKDDEWAEFLSKIGFFMGKFIYLLDAYEDLEDDLKKGQYNPFRKIYEQDDFDKHVYQILVMMMSEVGRTFEKLPIIDNVQILQNIIYSGVWCRYETVRLKRQNNQQE